MYRDDLIRAEMAAQRKTEETLAEETGLARSTISEIRSGRADNPTIKSLSAIARKLGIPLALLFEPKPKRRIAA